MTYGIKYWTEYILEHRTEYSKGMRDTLLELNLKY